MIRLVSKIVLSIEHKFTAYLHRYTFPFIRSRHKKVVDVEAGPFYCGRFRLRYGEAKL